MPPPGSGKRSKLAGALAAGANDAGMRSALEAAIATTTEQLKAAEANFANMRDGVSELAVHTVRVKQLESEIAPKEAELKSVNAAYHRLMENSVTLGRRAMPGLLSMVHGGAAARFSLSHASSGTDDYPDGAAAGDPPRPASSGVANESPSTSRAPSRSSALHSRGAASPAGVAAAPPLDASETADREALRHLASVVRENMSIIVDPLFALDKTLVETATEERDRIEAENAANAALQVAAAANAAAKADPKAVKPPAGPGASAVGVPKSLPVVAGPMAVPEVPKVDLDLCVPPGVDHHFFADVVKLRHHRVVLERQLKSLQAQLAVSRAIVLRRTNEGTSKALLKKHEKTAQQVKAYLDKLIMQYKDELVEAKRRGEQLQNNTAAAAAAGSAAAAHAQSGHASGSVASGTAPTVTTDKKKKPAGV
mgnify:CR=1 FL=1